MIFKKILSLLFFIFAAVVSLATSGLNSSSSSGSYFIHSECISPLVEMYITVENEVVTSPVMADLSQFGLPGRELNRGGMTGSIGGAIRSCSYEYSNEELNEHVISCFEDNVYLCSVLLKAQ
ncbi:MAG: hypothetical protein SGJ18_00045 [Pseudomonadota bacterium]|nr:hypothetical protein [Pseudomonadota bacterium]